jgi:ABC-type dipeptide/oligopeptide/nickel transport system permease subunit
MTEKPLSQGQLIWRRFRRHKLGALGAAIIAFLVIVTLFAHFISPYDYATQRRRFAFAPPTKVHFLFQQISISLARGSSIPIRPDRSFSSALMMSGGISSRARSLGGGSRSRLGR